LILLATESEYHGKELGLVSEEMLLRDGSVVSSDMRIKASTLPLKPETITRIDFTTRNAEQTYISLTFDK
jgi:hypothetical protein